MNYEKLYRKLMQEIKENAKVNDATAIMACGQGAGAATLYAKSQYAAQTLNRIAFNAENREAAGEEGQ